MPGSERGVDARARRASLRSTANGATAKPWPDRNVFSLIRSCAIATLAAAGVTRARAREELERRRRHVLELGRRRGGQRRELARGRADRGSRRRCAGRRRCRPGCRRPGRAPRPCSPGSARPCRTCGRAGRRPAGPARRRAAIARRAAAAGFTSPAERASRARWRSASARNAASFLRDAGSVAAIIATANRPALAAPASPIANVATGMPLGICTIDSSESSPRRYFDGTGTPSTGTVVFAASMPGRCAAPPAPAMMHAQAARAGVLGVFEHVVGHPVRGQHARLVGDAERVELRGRVPHDLPVAVAAHHHADQRRRLALCHPFPLRTRRFRVEFEREILASGSRRASRVSRSRRVRTFVALGRLTAASRDRRAACRCTAALADNAHADALIRHALRCRVARCAPARRSRARAAGAAAQSDADFLAAKAAFDKRRPRAARRARAQALRPRARAVRRLLAAEARARRRATPTRSARYLDALPDTPLADRLRVDWLKSLGRSGRLGRASRSTTRRRRRGHRARVLRRPVPRASATATPRSPPAKPLWFTGQATPDACEPLFAALIARGDAHASPTAARASGWRVEAGNVRLAQAIARRPAAARTAIADRDFARVERDPLRALAKGELRVERPAAAASSRSTRSSAPRAATPSAARAGVGQVARPACRRRTAATATRGSPTTRRASCIRRRTTGSAKRATRR